MEIDSAKPARTANTRPANPTDPRLLAKAQELAKILSHEQRLGAQDNAVIGGLGRYLAKWTETVAAFAVEAYPAEPFLRKRPDLVHPISAFRPAHTI